MLSPFLIRQLPRRRFIPLDTGETILLQGVSDRLADLLGKKPAKTVVVIGEVGTDNWGIGGETVTVRRA